MKENNLNQITSSNVYLDVLQMFVGKDELRPQFKTPFSIGELCIATDAHLLVFFDKKLTPNVAVYKGINPKGIINVIPKGVNENIILKVSVLEFEMQKGNLTDGFDEISDSKECSTCEGMGEVEWEFEKWSKDFECPACDGNGIIGESKEIPNGTKVFAYKETCQIKNSRFGLELFSKIVKTAKMLNEEEIILEYTTLPNSGSVFRIRDIKILIMPRNKDDDDNVIFNIE